MENKAMSQILNGCLNRNALKAAFKTVEILFRTDVLEELGCERVDRHMRTRVHRVLFG